MTRRPARSATTRRPHAGRGRRLAVLALLLLALGAVVFALGVQAVGQPPRLLGPYLERRAGGHNPLIEQTGVRLNRLLQWIDRGAVLPRLAEPTWALPPAATTRAAAAPAGRQVTVALAEQLRAAIGAAQPGDVITLAPGSYRFEGGSIDVSRAGTPQAPITLRAPQRGSVTLEFALLEGFHVRAPHWVFENLTIVGACRDHSDCEHAFHVVGSARNVVIRDNDLRDFNAHIKINGQGGAFPDGGRIEGNRLTNGAPRRTAAPVTPIDLVAASDWLIEGNYIADFVKDAGDYTSYGAFAKGGGGGNRFVRNVVLCEHRLRGAPGRRVGLSFGGGGSSSEACRDRRCLVEHERGLMRDNLIASCSDVGIYINSGAQSQLRHNTLLDTAGIQLRHPQSSAELAGNLIDGPLLVQQHASVHGDDNRVTSLPLLYLGLGRADTPFVAAGDLDLRWRTGPPRRPPATATSTAAVAVSGEPDLCGQSRPATPAYGAFEDFGACLRPARP